MPGSSPGPVRPESSQGVLDEVLVGPALIARKPVGDDGCQLDERLPRVPLQPIQVDLGAFFEVLARYSVADLVKARPNIAAILGISQTQPAAA